MESESQNSLIFWENKHINYKRSEIKIDNWLENFDDLIKKCNTPILDLGCGSGNDTLYLIKKNKKVIPCDQSSNAIKNIQNNFPEVLDTKCFNMLNGLPFDDNSFDLIIADLCLHYFRKEDTLNLIQEINRILTIDGTLLFRVNSINDINYGAGKGEEIEHHLFLTEDNILKRFFDSEDIKYFFKIFKIEYMKEKKLSRFGLEKKLYEVCVKKC